MRLGEAVTDDDFMDDGVPEGDCEGDREGDGVGGGTGGVELDSLPGPNAYTKPSCEPTNTVPSKPMDGDEATTPPVWYL